MLLVNKGITLYDVEVLLFHLSFFLDNGEYNYKLKQEREKFSHLDCSTGSRSSVVQILRKLNTSTFIQSSSSEKQVPSFVQLSAIFIVSAPSSSALIKGLPELQLHCFVHFCYRPWQPIIMLSCLLEWFRLSPGTSYYF